MNKSLLAAAVAGTFVMGAAHAQTNVSIGGVVQANIKSYKVSGARNMSNEMRIDDDYTSRFWLTGTEDLGGGLSALFYVENRLNTDLGSAGLGNGLTNGDSFVGLKGSWGQVTLGRHSWMGAAGLTTEVLAAKGITAMPSSMWATTSLMNQTGRSFVDYMDGASRRNNSITYRSPIFSGFSGIIGLSTNPAATEGVGTGMASDGREYFLQGSYNNGPMSLNLSHRDYDVEGRTGSDQKQTRFHGFYKFPMGLKVGLLYDRARQTAVAAGVGGASVSRTAWGIPVSYVFGNNAIMATYARAGDLSGTSNTGAHMWTLGWDYAFSARTNVGVYYSRLSNESAAAYQPFAAGLGLTGSALVAGEKASTFALGVKHTF